MIGTRTFSEKERELESERKKIEEARKQLEEEQKRFETEKRLFREQFSSDRKKLEETRQSLESLISEIRREKNLFYSESASDENRKKQQRISSPRLKNITPTFSPELEIEQNLTELKEENPGSISERKRRKSVPASPRTDETSLRDPKKESPRRVSAMHHSSIKSGSRADNDEDPESNSSRKYSSPSLSKKVSKDEDSGTNTQPEEDSSRRSTESLKNKETTSITRKAMKAFNSPLKGRPSPIRSEPTFRSKNKKLTSAELLEQQQQQQTSGSPRSDAKVVAFLDLKVLSTPLGESKSARRSNGEARGLASPRDSRGNKGEGRTLSPRLDFKSVSPLNELKALISPTTPRNGISKSGVVSRSDSKITPLPRSDQSNTRTRKHRTPELAKSFTAPKPRRSSSPSAFQKDPPRPSRSHRDASIPKKTYEGEKEINGETLKTDGDSGFFRIMKKLSVKEEKRKKQRKKIHRKNSDAPVERQKRAKSPKTAILERSDSESDKMPKPPENPQRQTSRGRTPLTPIHRNLKILSEDQIPKPHQSDQEQRLQASDSTQPRSSLDKHYSDDGDKPAVQKVVKRRRAPSKKRPAVVTSDSAPIIQAMEVQDFSREGLEEVPEDLFTNGQVVNTMVELNLQQNRLLKIPEDISLCSKLVILDISYNNILILPGAIGALHLLEKLSLSGNPYIKIPAEISRLTKLQRIRLAQNRYTSIPEQIFGLSSLKKLNLSRNSITKVSPKIASMMNLKVLNLAFNKISELPPELGSCTSLEELDLRENYLRELPDQICNLLHLETAIFFCNRLTRVPAEFKLERLPELALLDLQYNQIEELPRDFFDGTSKFVELYAGHNKLTHLPPSISRCPSITILDFKKNFLTHIPTLSELKNLTQLNLGYNHLDSFPAGLGACTNLRTLNLFGNKITSLPFEFNKLVRLKNIYLGYNLLTDFPYLDQVSNSILKVLFLAGNPISTISNKISTNAWSLTCLYLNALNLKIVPKGIGFLYHLEQLDLSHNSLTSVPTKLGGLTSLYSLDLSHNFLSNTTTGDDSKTPFKSLSKTTPPYKPGWDLVDWWYHLENIGYVDLSHNNLTRAPFGVTELLGRGGVELRLDHNPLVEPMMTSFGREMSSAESYMLFPTGRFNVGWSEMVGQRPTQEDCFCIAGPIGDPELDITLFGLFDGHASRSAAHFAATNFADYLLKHVPFDNLDRAPLKALRATYYNINEAWRDILTVSMSPSPTPSPDPEYPLEQNDRFCGSTGVVALFIGNRLYVANLGDSRAVLYKGGANLDSDEIENFVERLSHDHKPEHEDEEQRIRESGGYVIDNRVSGILGVSRGIGDFFLSPLVSAKCHFTMVDLPQNPDAFVCICCDGVWDELSDQQAMAVIARHLEFDDDMYLAATKLRDYAFLLGSDDNVSSVVIKWYKK